MYKNLNKPPTSKKKSTSNVNKKNKHSGKKASNKIKNKEQISITRKEYPNGYTTQELNWKKGSQPLNRDAQAHNDITSEQDWKNFSQKQIVNNLFNKFIKNKQIDEKKERNEEKKKNEKDSLKTLEEKQKMWFDDLKKSMKNSIKEFNDAQKNALDDLDRRILDKISSKDKEDEFLKDMLFILLVQNAFSKDLQNLGRVDVSNIEGDSYL